MLLQIYININRFLKQHIEQNEAEGHFVVVTVFVVYVFHVSSPVVEVRFSGPAWENPDC